LFRLQSDGDMPASSVSVPAAGLRARAAAAAVLAVVASATLLGTSTGGAPEPSVPGPRHLDPTRSYASFGWLPGVPTSGEEGATGRTEMWLGASSRTWDFSLSVYSAGQCRLVAADRSRRTEMTCPGGVGNTGESAPVRSRTRDVRGHPAYVVALPTVRVPSGAQAPEDSGRPARHVTTVKDDFLAWEYARGSWALLEYFSASTKLALRIADHATVGVPTGSIRFPAQTTGVPATWRVADVAFTVRAGVLAAGLYQLTVGPRNLAPGGGGYPANMPSIEVGPPQAARYCTLPGVPVVHRVIDRYEVLVQNDSASRPPQEQLCATDADGLSVAMYVIGSHPVLSVAAIFSHMRLLGPDPAHWTARPLG
jgi:hypothetical protein